MYDRFTDKALNVMQRAHREAEQLNHEYIGTEHVLLGLIEETPSVAENVLKQLGIERARIREEVAKIVVRGPYQVRLPRLVLSPRVRSAIQYSMQEAVTFGHNYVGTEHLLIGLASVEESVSHQVLDQLGLTAERVRSEVAKTFGFESPPPHIESGLQNWEHDWEFDVTKRRWMKSAPRFSVWSTLRRWLLPTEV